MRTQKQHNSGFSAVTIIVAIVIIALGGTAGWFIYQNNYKPKSVTTVATSKPPASTPAKTASTVDLTANWKQYCSPQEKSCFKYPLSWIAKDIGAVDPNGDGLQLTSPAGTVIWFQSAVTSLSGDCDASKEPHIFIHKVLAVPNVANLYIVESGGENSTNHVGIVGAVNGQSPKTGDIGDCVYYTTFKSHHDPSINAWFESNSTAAFKTSDLSAAELILESYRY